MGSEIHEKIPKYKYQKIEVQNYYLLPILLFSSSLLIDSGTWRCRLPSSLLPLLEGVEPESCDKIKCSLSFLKLLNTNIISNLILWRYTSLEFYLYVFSYSCCFLCKAILISNSICMKWVNGNEGYTNDSSMTIKNVREYELQNENICKYVCHMHSSKMGK